MQAPAPTRVAPLIVVPGNDLHHTLVEPRGQRGVHDGRGRIPVHVHRDHRILGILQDSLEGTLGRHAEGGVDVGGGSVYVYVDGQGGRVVGGGGRTGRVCVVVGPGSR